MALRVNGRLVGGVNNIPSYTQAQYDALSVKPEFWICIDKDYLDVPSENVSYGDSNVEDTLDNIIEQIDKAQIILTTIPSSVVTITDAISNIYNQLAALNIPELKPINYSVFWTGHDRYYGEAILYGTTAHLTLAGYNTMYVCDVDNGTVSYKILNEIKSATRSTTTSAYGYFGWIASPGVKVISAHASEKFLVLAKWGDGWYVARLDSTGTSFVGNETFDVTYDYYE